MIAYSAVGSGALTLLDLGSGQERVLDDGGPFGTISFSPDGTEIAYVNSEREVFVVSTDGERRAVGETKNYMPYVQWGHGGWLWYATGRESDVYSAVVPAGATEPRQVGTGRTVRINGSPVEARLAYADCDVDLPFGCTEVSEDPDGSNRVVLATDTDASGGHYSPDGSRIVFAEAEGDQVRVIARSSGGGGPAIDLGPGDDQMLEYGVPPGLGLFSPDGTEVLSLEGTKLIALRMDGSGQRTIADPGPTYPWHAGFTPSGDVLFKQEINTESPPDDTPEIAYTTIVADADGSLRTLLELDPVCSFAFFSSAIATVSGDGGVLAYDCGLVQRISDGSIVARFEAGGRPLGFTSDGGTIFVSGTSVVLVNVGGGTMPLAETHSDENREVEGLLAAYFHDGS
jgi:hypothetical protein